MLPSTVNPLLEPFRTTAAALVRDRPEVDGAMIRDIFDEAATMLHNGLALDGLDEHDTPAVVACLCVDLCAADPGAAVRARSAATLQDPGDLHDPDGASAAYLMAASILQL